MAKKKSKRESKPSSRESDKKLYAFLASFFTIIGFIIALIIKKDDEYIMFYAKQGLVLFIGQVIIGLVSWLFFFIIFLKPLLWILWVILWLVTWINALSGKKKSTFIIGELAEKIKL